MTLRKLLALLMCLTMVFAMATLTVGCGEDTGSSASDDEDEDENDKEPAGSSTDGGDTTTTTTDGEGSTTTTTTGRDTAANTTAVEEYVEENYDDLVELLSNGAPDEVGVEVEAKGSDIIVTFTWGMLDDLTEEELDEVAASAREEMAPEWAPAFWEIRDDVASLASIQLEFYTSDGEYAFGAKVDEDTPRAETEEDLPSYEDEPVSSDAAAIVGEWEAEIDLTEQGEEDPMYYTFTFMNDGTVDIEASLGEDSNTSECEYYFEDGYLYIDYEMYDYTLDGDTLVLDYVSGAEGVEDEMIEALFPMECARVA